MNVLIDGEANGETFEMTVDVKDENDYAELTQAIVTNFLTEGRGDIGMARIRKVTPIVL